MNRIGSFAYDWMVWMDSLVLLTHSEHVFVLLFDRIRFGWIGNLCVCMCVQYDRPSGASDALSIIMRLESISSNTQTCCLLWRAGPALTINSIGKSHLALARARCWCITKPTTPSLLGCVIIASVSQNNIALLTGISFYEIIKAIIIHERYDMGSCSVLLFHPAHWKFMSFACANMISLRFLASRRMSFSFLVFFFARLVGLSLLESWQCSCASVFDAVISNWQVRHAIRIRCEKYCGCGRAGERARAARTHCIHINRMSASGAIYIYPKIYKSTTTTTTRQQLGFQAIIYTTHSPMPPLRLI